MQLLFKPEGITPLEAIRKFRATHPSFVNKKLGYAGRLDPMASGLLLILEDGENSHRQTYERMPKTYRISVLFGIATDSYDVLGIITSIQRDVRISPSALNTAIASHRTTFSQEYPPYSAGRINGKPMYYWAKRGLLHTIPDIPKKMVTISDITVQSQTLITMDDLYSSVRNRVQAVRGDFRIDAITESWKKSATECRTKSFPVVQMEVQCSHGTYMRSLAFSIGNTISIPALALNIQRTSIGPYTLAEALQV